MLAGIREPGGQPGELRRVLLVLVVELGDDVVGIGHPAPRLEEVHIQPGGGQFLGGGEAGAALAQLRRQRQVGFGFAQGVELKHRQAMGGACLDQVRGVDLGAHGFVGGFLRRGGQGQRETRIGGRRRAAGGAHPAQERGDERGEGQRVSGAQIRLLQPAGQVFEDLRQWCAHGPSMPPRRRPR